MSATGKTLRGGTFNLRYGRKPFVVLHEVSKLFTKHELDFLAVQEFSDYRETFARSHDFNVIPTSGQCESGIIVRRGIWFDKVKVRTYGDGWVTVRGGRFPAAVHNEARLAGWLYVRSVLPLDRGGQVDAPRGRSTVWTISRRLPRGCAATSSILVGSTRGWRPATGTNRRRPRAGTRRGG
jgi:hypothetical protein